MSKQLTYSRINKLINEANKQFIATGDVKYLHLRNKIDSLLVEEHIIIKEEFMDNVKDHIVNILISINNSSYNTRVGIPVKLVRRELSKLNYNVDDVVIKDVLSTLDFVEGVSNNTIYLKKDTNKTELEKDKQQNNLKKMATRQAKKGLKDN